VKYPSLIWQGFADFEPQFFDAIRKQLGTLGIKFSPLRWYLITTLDPVEFGERKTLTKYSLKTRFLIMAA
jgi:hypothetical protein